MNVEKFQPLLDDRLAGPYVDYWKHGFNSNAIEIEKE